MVVEGLGAEEKGLRVIILGESGIVLRLGEVNCEN